jgi:hypothetical protein
MSEQVTYVQFTPGHIHEWKIIQSVYNFRENVWKVLRYCELCDDFENVSVEGPTEA